MRQRKSKPTENSPSWCGSLASEFGDLAPARLTTPPPNAATARDLAQLWGMTESPTNRLIKRMLAEGKLKEAGKFYITCGQLPSYPVMHYVRVR